MARGFARAIEPVPVRRGRLYHVHHRPVHEAIGQADNRVPRRSIDRLTFDDAQVAPSQFEGRKAEYGEPGRNRAR